MVSSDCETYLQGDYCFADKCRAVASVERVDWKERLVQFHREKAVEGCNQLVCLSINILS